MRLIPLTIRLSPSTVEELRLRAEESKCSVTEIARLALEDALSSKSNTENEMHDLLAEIRKLAETSVHLSALSVGVSAIPHNWSDADIAASKQQTANHIINGHDIGLAVRQKFEKTLGVVMSKEIIFNKK